MTREEQVLRFVNRLRNRLGVDPLTALVPGTPGRAEQCTIAKSLPEGSADEHFVIAGTDGGDYLEVPTPQYAQQFIHAFDAGRYPHLVA